MASITPTSSLSPTVSVILAVRNEAQFIKNAVESILQQDTPNFQLEVLVLDGMSSDGTAGIVTELARSDSRVRLLSNKLQKTPFAFNLGLKESKGEYVCIFGAHTSYNRDYISVCLNELIKHEAVGCSGQVITQPANTSSQANVVAWSLSHWFGSSTRSVRTQPEGFRDAIPYPIMKKHALITVGGYDEELHRNQDNDMNQRLRSRGYRLYLTGKTQCQYFVKATVRSLLQYAFNTGYWNVISFRRNKTAMRLRHFVPFAFVLVLLGAATAAVTAPFASAVHKDWLLAPFLVIMLAHLLIGLLAGLQVALRERSLAALLLPFVFFGFHMSYGLGTLWAVLRNAQASRPAAPPYIREPHVS